MYPSVMLEFNIAPNTQIGRIIIPDKVYEHENVYHIDEEKYSRSGEFIENMMTDNTIEFCHRWFGLADIQEFISDIDDYYSSNRRFGKFSNLQSVFSPIEYTSSTLVENPIEFVDNSEEMPIIFYNKPNTELKEKIGKELLKI